MFVEEARRLLRLYEGSVEDSDAEILLEELRIDIDIDIMREIVLLALVGLAIEEDE